MKTNTKQSSAKIVKIFAAVIAILALIVLGYRFYNRPVQTWNADAFEGRNPDKLASKSHGERYWVGDAAGSGFYITDETVSAGDNKVYCVSGGVTSENATFMLGDSTGSAKNGYFTHCASLTVNEKRQLSFKVTDGQVQIYRVDRKR